ncbi:molybdate ABC transporter substrate-binding protein [Biformimicrobium ophioploci]|uniref:Molybdate ABC transporter substrate-binding protein n=1 Tax=Biformimicrobium ophioploci TaxID=3036711 RepID=A0ABQ6M065_9GAMM|nr:molybdate ABC transporter substrate-binding protein [Microbulbifer sp. NKW57]GMG87722.1 molybdate ABC transporter substrate-binding protein [Microbulbifer sp. NKW57]
MGLKRALCFFLLLGLQPAQAADCELRVAVAASFRPALEQLLPDFERQQHCRVRLSSGSSGTLYQQALHGAPFDLFLSADAERPLLLEQQQKILPGSRSTYASGLLALWHPAPGTDASAQLQQWPEKIVLADPQLAPFGTAARQAMQALGIWDAKQAQLARTHNAGQAFLILDSGNARMGFVAASQMLAAGRDNYWLVPRELYQPIAQQLVVLKRGPNPDAAQALAEYLVSAPVQSRIAALGYAADNRHGIVP